MPMKFKSRILRLPRIALLTALAVSLTGCQEPGDTADSTTPVSELPPASMESGDNHAHAHPEKGPHKGDLVELGNEEYHGEILHHHDEGKVEIYILDGAARSQVAIDAATLTINLSHKGQPRQFVLTAKPDAADASGKSSRFVSDDKDLSSQLDEESSNPRLVVNINGKSYRGVIQHHHDHAGHDHESSHGE